MCEMHFIVKTSYCFHFTFYEKFQQKPLEKLFRIFFRISQKKLMECLFEWNKIEPPSNPRDQFMGQIANDNVTSDFNSNSEKWNNIKF